MPAQSSAVQRAGQALAEHNFINQILAIDKQADVVVVGDLNDYQFSPALSVLKTGTSDGSGTPTLTPDRGGPAGSSPGRPVPSYLGLGYRTRPVS